MVKVKETLDSQMDEIDPATLKQSLKASSTRDSNGNGGIVTDDEDPSPPPSPIIYRTRGYKRRNENNPEEKDQRNLEIQKQREEKSPIARVPRKKPKTTATLEELELVKQLKDEEKRRKNEEMAEKAHAYVKRRNEEREAAAQARQQKELQKEADRKAREKRYRVRQEREEATTRRTVEEKQRVAEEKNHQQEKVSGNNEFHGPRSLSASTSAVIPVHSNTTGFRSSLPAFVPSSPHVSPESSPVRENPSINNDDFCQIFNVPLFAPYKEVAEVVEVVEKEAAIFGKDGDYIKNETITFPDKLGGMIIGKGGESINRIRQQSGAGIVISPSVRNEDREITIIGTQPQIQAAQYMLHKSIENANKRFSQRQQR